MDGQIEGIIYPRTVTFRSFVFVCRFRDPGSLANGKHNSTNDRHRHGSMMSIYSLCALEITRARYYCCDTGRWPSGLVGGCDTERSHTLNHTGAHTHIQRFGGGMEKHLRACTYTMARVVWLCVRFHYGFCSNSNPTLLDLSKPFLAPQLHPFTASPRVCLYTRTQARNTLL